MFIAKVVKLDGSEMLKDLIFLFQNFIVGFFFSYFKDKDIGIFKSARKQKEICFFNIPGFI